MGPYPKKRKATPKVEEVNFDPEARHEFLTGFHKRKVQRIKHAQDAAEKRMREEKRQDRKQLREDRAAEFNRVVEEHKRQLKEMQAALSDNESDSNDDDGSDQEWEGIEEPPVVDYEAEYIDEDKYTTVTVEEMDASREGLRKAIHEDNSDDEEKKEERTQPTEPEKKPVKKHRKSTSDIKKKKKQFRYECKSERKLTQAKQRMTKSKKAKSRREQ